MGCVMRKRPGRHILSIFGNDSLFSLSQAKIMRYMHGPKHITKQLLLCEKEGNKCL